MCAAVPAYTVPVPRALLCTPRRREMDCACVRPPTKGVQFVVHDGSRLLQELTCSASYGTAVSQHQAHGSTAVSYDHMKIVPGATRWTHSHSTTQREHIHEMRLYPAAPVSLSGMRILRSEVLRLWLRDGWSARARHELCAVWMLLATNIPAY